MSGSTELGVAGDPVVRRASGPWLWSRSTDLAVFGGSALLALGLVPLGPRLSSDGALPAWGFLFFVVCVDVAHVWSTLFRTYFDRDELRRRPLLYAGVPAVVLAVGFALHLASPIWFWRVLAYTAVYHFIRQQIGWVAVYRARAGERDRLDKLIDEAAIYASTLFPLAYWHASSPRAFEWFVEGDFFLLPKLASAIPVLGFCWGLTLVAYTVRSLSKIRGGHMNLGKHVVVFGTAATWFTGIIASNSDFQFTVANVIVHGAPYFALLYFYLRARAEEGAGGLMALFARGGVAAFFAIAISLAFAEELIWDRLVWHARPTLFGGDGAGPTFSRVVMSLLVPVLALPQGTHYVLDAVLWRRKDTGPAQARALGFGRPLVKRSKIERTTSRRAPTL
jgi:hypothetical protein